MRQGKRFAAAVVAAAVVVAEPPRGVARPCCADGPCSWDGSFAAGTLCCLLLCRVLCAADACVQEYNLAFQFGRASCQVSRRFSDLAKFHRGLRAVSEALPPFPPKRRLAGKHMINPVNVALRASELEQYFSELLRVPGVLASDVFYESLGLGAGGDAGEDVRELFQQYGHLQLGEELRSRARSAAPPAGGRAGGAGAHTAADQDYLYAQRFHLSAQGARAGDDGDGDGEAPAYAVPVPALFFVHTLRFYLRRVFWDGDRAVREDADGRVWFSFLGPIPSVAVGKNPRAPDYYALSNASGSVPLIYLLFDDDAHVCFILEAMADGLVGNVICTVYRDDATEKDRPYSKSFRVVPSEDSGIRHDGLPLFLLLYIYIYI